ncbi:MAG: pyrrolo-quinoline quinone [Mucilaginibacter sp.]|nr:pyrrolo-quinoline quinone [Mucilaginibacter sp.]
MKKKLSFAFALLLLAGCTRTEDPIETGKDWPAYGGNSMGNRYSPLSQINAANVKNLKIAWMYNAAEPINPKQKTQDVKAIQCQPIVIRGVLYGTTPELKLFALNAETGKQLWKFEPKKNEQRFNTSRGVTYWENGDDKRILYSCGSNLYEVNAKDGKAVTGFGKNGIVDLHEGLGTNLGHDVENLSVSATTPGVIYKNTFIIGSSVLETGDAAPGHIRAFDVVTGKIKWIFHTIPQPGEFGYDTWPPNAYRHIGGANSWGGMTVDNKRGMVYVATGSPASDYYGEGRTGMNLFGNCVLSLNAETGKLKWYFQTIHHDLWDRDLPCPPNLGTIKRADGKSQDMVVQTTKDGLVYVLDRDKGTSLFPIEDRPVPQKALPGEHPWPTQRYPLKPAPLCDQVFTAADITNISPEAHDFIKKRFDEIHSDNKFTPPSVKGTLLFGVSGGAEWGGNAIDPDGVFYQNANNDPWEMEMVDTVTRNKNLSKLSHGNALYVTNCAVCHGQDRMGSIPEFPSLVNIGKKRTADDIKELLKTGSGRMPSFKTSLSDQDRNSIVGFLLNNEVKLPNLLTAKTAPGSKEVASDFPYRPLYVKRIWRVLTDKNGYPGVKPPWGTLNAIDLKTGNYLWRVPLGEYPELVKKGIRNTGTPNYGGPLVTASGLLFIAGTKDEKIRAFDKKTGKVIWEYQLPAGGFATPITYEMNGKQYIVIAAGGARGQKPGGNYVAFALP